MPHSDVGRVLYSSLYFPAASLVLFSSEPCSKPELLSSEDYFSSMMKIENEPPSASLEINLLVSAVHMQLKAYQFVLSLLNSLNHTDNFQLPAVAHTTNKG